jgi:predicted metal-dependent phosphoesterase TrpH
MVKNLIVDLHVHTPASKDYIISADNDIDASYLNIIYLAAEKNVNVIGIADHFTVSGYEKLMKLKRETESLALLLQ